MEKNGIIFNKDLSKQLKNKCQEIIEILEEKGGTSIKEYKKIENLTKEQKEEKSPKEEGKKDAIKEKMKEEEKARGKLEELLERNKKEIYRASSFFPFDLFPDIIIIYPDRVGIIFKEFFLSKQILSVPIKDIKDVEIDISIFFAALKLTIDGYKDNPATIRFLKVSNAIKARRIVQGLFFLSKQGVDLLSIPVEELISKMEGLGTLEEND